MQNPILLSRWIGRWQILMMLAAAASLLLGACGFLASSAPQRTFTLEDLLIVQEDVPSSWEVKEPLFPAGDNLCTTECIAVRVRATGEERSIEGGTHSIYRYRNADIARRTFEVVYLTEAKREASLNGWTYESPVAEQSHFGCREASDGTTYCEWGARYEEYIMVFSMAMASGERSLAETEQVVKAIDERMVQYLGGTFENSD